MNETYVECLIKRKSNPLAPILKYLLYGLAIICAGLSFIGLSILFVPAVIIAVVAYFVLPMLDLEYEYLYLDKEISIDKVMGKEKRKHVATINLNNVETIAPANSHALDSYKSRPHTDKDFSSREEYARTYIIPCEDQGGLVLYKLEMNEEMIKAIKTVFPRKIVEY